MKKYIQFLILFVFALMFALSCSSKNPSQTSSDNNEPLTNEQSAEEHEHHTLKISEEQQKEWGIAVGSPRRQTAAFQIEVPGTLELNQNRTAHISSFVNGKISDLSADLGDKVKKGQTLLVINSPDYAKAQADFLITRAEMNFSSEEYERAEMLLKEKAIEEKEFLKRKAEYERLATEYGALGSQLHSYGITHDQIDVLIEKCKYLREKEYKCDIAEPFLPILAPLSGTVIFRDAVRGDHVEPGKVLFTTSDLTTLWAELDAYEKDIPYIKKDSTILIRSSLYPQRAFPAAITYISDVIDPELRTIKIRAEVRNTENLLKPHMYITGLIESQNTQKQVLTVPEEAVQNLEGEKIVFILNPDQEFEARHVKLGDKIGDQMIIKEGLTENDRVVLDGAFTLKSELNKAEFGHHHAH
jgi:cobalt-zinc-cadmium efflux system membrane fusion protein